MKPVYSPSVMGTGNRDKVYLDAIRVFAIFFVVANHTSAFAFPSCENGTDIVYGLKLLSNEIVKMAVPLFFMVSGALLLPKAESIEELFKKRVLRFSLVYIFTCTIQYAYMVYEGRAPASLVAFAGNVYHGGSGVCFSAVWFLRAYLGILLMLPILRVLVSSMQRMHYVYAMILQIVFCGVVPALMLCVGHRGVPCFLNEWLPFQPYSENLHFAFGYCVFYMFLGYFAEFHCSVSDSSWKRWLFAGVFCLALGVVCMLVALNPELAPKNPQSVIFLTAFLPVPCIAAYLITKRFFSRLSLSRGFSKCIGILGMASFTVMLTENLLRVNLSPVVCNLVPIIGSRFTGWVLAILVTSLALLLGVLLKQIPGIRKLV